MLDTVVGRERELAAVGELLEEVADGPTVLVLSGEAGIGKTTIWRNGVQRARERGFTVLACRAAVAEVKLSYAGFSDLLAGVASNAFEHLPRPQRRALDAALLRGLDDEDDEQAPDPRAVAAGFLSVLNELSRATPALVAIDDAQWLDEPTRRVVEFAVRRCPRSVRLLIARRDDDPLAAAELRPGEPGRQRTVSLGPMSLGALHHVLTRSTGSAWTRPALVRIARLSGGNPFFALELARSQQRRAHDAADLPYTLRAVVRERLDRLPAPVREVLRVASALTAPRVDLVAQAAETSQASTLLDAAEDSGVVTLSADGAVRFTHPLLATGLMTEAPPSVRRALHQRLSGIVDDVEERARHLALAALGPDADTVAALDLAADAARQRGAPDAAAELRELAIGLGADDPQRRVQAAHDHFHADDPTQARRLLRSAIEELGPGVARAEALALLGVIHYLVENYTEAITILRQAVDEAVSDAALRVRASLELGFALLNGSRIDDALPVVTDAAEQAEQLGDRGLLAEALGCLAIARFLDGQGVDDATMARSVELEDLDRPTHATRWPSLNATLAALWSHRLDDARDGFAALRRRCLDGGLESDLWFVSYHQADTALRCGDIVEAERIVADMAERATVSGADLLQTYALVARAHLQAWSGDLEHARANAEAAYTRLSDAGMASGTLFTLSDLGMIELSTGDDERAASWLVPAATAMMSMGLKEPAVAAFLPDAAAALVALRRFDEAEPLVELLETSGRRPGRSWAEAVGARCRGLLLAAQRRTDDALAAFERAMTAHDRLPMLRYDRARTLLALGAFQRRCNQRRAADASLTEALGLFTEVGTAQWAGNARAELDRLGLRHGPGNRLSPSEDRVARLAASGKTVREVAATLHVSPKTVEAHLTRVYRKLGIRSRAELGRMMAETTGNLT